MKLGPEVLAVTCWTMRVLSGSGETEGNSVVVNKH